MKHETGEPQPSPRWPFLWIVAAAALAHLWCLGSQFYMDDFPQIRDNEVIRTGNLADSSLLTWTHLWFIVQHRLFGMSPVAFHAGNWLLHTSVACVLFGFGRDFLGEKRMAGVAWFGALLFAVHPLASEIPNYARTQDLAWVTLFSLLSGWLLLAFARHGGWWKLAGCAACVLGATFSKGPGLFHALMVCGAVGLTSLSPGQWNFLKRKSKWIAIAVVLFVSVLFLSGLLDAWLIATARWAEPRFIGHAYTLARVFWEFSWRAVFPLALSSDHLVTETLIPPGAKYWNIPDKIAMLSMVSMLALTGFGVFLACREKTRVPGVCLFLFVATMWFRMLFLVPEFMPEYRIYPGMPWFCLGAAILLAAAWKWMFGSVQPRVPAAILLATFAFLSAKRSFVWHDLDRLAADVLKRYPARARAIWELDDRDVTIGNWQAIIDRQKNLWPEVERRFVAENQRLAPAREIPSGDFVLAMIAIHGRHARAISHTENPAAALRLMARLEAHMKLMKMDETNKPLEWGYFHHDKGLILETAGNLGEAAECLRKKCIPPFWAEDLRRVEKKLTGG